VRAALSAAARALGVQAHTALRLDIKAILMPPCIFHQTIIHPLVLHTKYTGRCNDGFNVRA
jgi:hypothetical protein